MVSSRTSVVHVNKRIRGVLTLVDNIAQAIIVVGMTYLAVAFPNLSPLVWWVAMIGVLFSWQMTADESKDYLKAQAEYYRAKTKAIEKEGNNAKKD